jgi:hypothetical protein
MPDEKREAPRVPLTEQVGGDVMVLQPMAVRDVSLRGALVETRFPLHLNSLHDLRLDLNGRSIVVKGRVVHSVIADVDDDVLVYWNGVEFVEPSAHAAAAIGEFLRSMEAERTS